MSENENEVTFEVMNKKFWVLETKNQTEGKSWVFNTEKVAVLKLREMLSLEDINFEDPDVMEIIGKKYNLQEIEIGDKAFQVKPVSWFKVALLGFAK